MSIDRAGRDELMYAIVDREVSKILRLLDEGYDVNASDKRGWTPLHFASQNNDAETVRLLLHRGAYHSPRDDNGNTPLSNAVFNSRGEGECISALLDAGADADDANDHGVSPRLLANTIANYDVKRFFT